MHGSVGEPVALPLDPPGGGEEGWTWSLELPEDASGVRLGPASEAGTPRVVLDRPGSEVVVATLTDPAGVPVTVLPVRVTAG